MALELLRTSEKAQTAETYHLTRNGVTLRVDYCVNPRPEETSGTRKHETWSVNFFGPGAKDLGMSALVVRRPGSIGYSYGLFQLYFFGEDHRISNVFEEDWGTDTIGYLSEEEIVRWIDRLLDMMGYSR